MKIFDGHMHAWGNPATPEAMLEKMAEIGISGGCVFSNHPLEHRPDGSCFEDRLAEVLAWSKGYEDRIFPVLWIHPYEENIIEKIHIAVDAGVMAFKMICSGFYVYEEGCLDVLREITKLGKPIIFHTGILWDGKVSSNYNRPVNWEALLDIEGIRFSLAHCSWPWIDECIALYGKFLNAKTSGKNVDMFFDITPGTPEIYRRDLFTKLYMTGYNIGDSIMFGTDANADSYHTKWASTWLKIDGDLLDELGVSTKYREKLYGGNLMRFLGLTESSVEIESPTPDNANTWRAINPDVPEIIRKWYKKLEFHESYDKEFERALAEIKISDAISAETYNVECLDGRRNLLSYLYLAEKTAEKYAERGIPEDILIETLKDLKVWTRRWTVLEGKLHLGELGWLKNHISARIFKLGRLQFCMAECEYDVEKYGIKRGDPIIEIHVQEGAPLLLSECEKSIAAAKEFFAKYFPEFKYEYFTAHSWLLDEGLDEYLNEKSNIIAFRKMFDIVKTEKSDSILRYVLGWKINEDNVAFAIPETDFARKIKRAALSGKSFTDGFGLLKK